MKIVGKCFNTQCKWPIYEGDEVWKLGNKLFCHSECLIEFMKTEVKQHARSSGKYTSENLRWRT